MLNRTPKHLFGGAIVAAVASLVSLSTAPAAAALEQEPMICSFDAGSGKLSVRGTGGWDFSAGIRRDGSQIVITDRRAAGAGPGEPMACGGTPTVHNLNRIVVDGTSVARYESLLVDLRGGPLGPGKTGEGSRGASEIEIKFVFDEPTNDIGGTGLRVIAGPGRDRFALGTRGGRAAINLNAEKESGDEDADIRLRHPPFPVQGAPIIDISSGNKSDVISAAGGPGAGGVLGARQADLTVTAGAGADRLIGGRGADWLDGGRGIDEFTGGLGNDNLRARDSKIEQLDCGGGPHDTAKADADEMATALSCEEFE